MLFRSAALAAASLATVAQAQYNIDASEVDQAIKDNWCMNQEKTCPKICEQTKPGTTIVNECDSETLQYGCLCGDNKKPNMSEYSLTIPFFVCREWVTNCVSDCGTDNACSSSCTQDNPCGAQDPERVTTTDSTATGKPTASVTESKTDDGTTIYTGTPGSEDDDEDSGSGSGSGGNNDSAATTLLDVGRVYGTAFVLGSMFVGFAML